MFFWCCVVLFASAGWSVDAAEGMTGEPRAVPVNDTEVLRAAHFAVSEFNAEQRVAYKLVSIKSVVAGVNYILEVLLGRAKCQSLSAELRCRFVVTEMPWNGSRALTKKKCRPSN
uniref:Cystatin domain-containing protein n=1 Tax=Gasterosteus aculeatus aculeatus TaxID=481459 RepID=A0AAQ4QWW4_GASAC